MKLTIESTEHLLEYAGAPVRLWRGKTEGGLEVEVLVAGIAVPADAPQPEIDAFTREFVEEPTVNRPIDLQLAALKEKGS